MEIVIWIKQLIWSVSFSKKEYWFEWNAEADVYQTVLEKLMKRDFLGFMKKYYYDICFQSESVISFKRNNYSRNFCLPIISIIDTRENDKHLIQVIYKRDIKESLVAWLFAALGAFFISTGAFLGIYWMIFASIIQFAAVIISYYAVTNYEINREPEFLINAFENVGIKISTVGWAEAKNNRQ